MTTATPIRAYAVRAEGVIGTPQGPQDNVCWLLTSESLLEVLHSKPFDTEQAAHEFARAQGWEVSTLTKQALAERA